MSSFLLPVLHNRTYDYVHADGTSHNIIAQQYTHDKIEKKHSCNHFIPQDSSPPPQWPWACPLAPWLPQWVRASAPRPFGNIWLLDCTCEEYSCSVILRCWLRWWIVVNNYKHSLKNFEVATVQLSPHGIGNFVHHFCNMRQECLTSVSLRGFNVLQYMGWFSQNWYSVPKSSKT